MLLCSLRERPYEVIDHCPRVNVHAHVLSDDELISWFPLSSSMGSVRTTAAVSAALKGCQNAFLLAVMDRQIEFVLCADSEYVLLL